ncbi:transient receptor potential cation channel subfamily a member 1-like [Gigaspora margarita]|uniref:Transient receptor potential cation channel subfamily a member 1-like n=1 Tax=Gigaspora margarita TaxID=4874 RepID=A0A8H4ENZ2_GIGMA|nr:transient receptor potential cation channel subfamily a member 1-like [Gigaspora margarita]
METTFYDNDENSTIIQIEETGYSDSSGGSYSSSTYDSVEVKFAQIVCSPRMKYVTTTYIAVNDDDGKFSEATLWSVTEANKLEKISTIMGHQIMDVKPKLWAVSDYKHIVFKTNYSYYNFEMFDAEKGESEILYFPDNHNLVNQLAFIQSGELLVALTEPAYRICVFKLNNLKEWIFSSSFDLSYFCNAFIIIEGNLILFDDKTFQLTKWNINTLKLETSCLIDWCYKVKLVEVNQGGELLAVYADYVKDETLKNSRIYIYSLKTGMKIAFYECKESIVVDKIYFIAYEAGERLLVRTQDLFNKDLFIYLMDPFTLKNPISAVKLFDTDVWTQDIFIIKSDKKTDKVIGVIDDKLDIYKLVRKNWISYIRKKLGDYNKIFVLSDTEYIAKLINNELSRKEKNFTKSKVPPDEANKYTFEGSFLKWNLYYKSRIKGLVLIEIEALLSDNDGNTWIPVDGESKRTINPNFQPPEHQEALSIIRCKCLKNDDLLMLTTFGILIWTVYPPKGIRLHYYWGRARIRSGKRFNLYFGYDNPFNLPSDLKPYTNAFPDSKFQIIIKNKNLSFGDQTDQNQFFFKELLEDYISDKFFIINYGSSLMKTFLFLKEDEWVEKFCKTCYNIVFSSNGLKSTSDIQLLSIISEVFPQLLQRHSVYLARFLSQTSFVTPLADSELTPEKKPSLINVSILKITHYWNKLIYGSADAEDKIKLLIPLPNFVNYPKEYSTWNELRNPYPSCFINFNDLSFYKTWNGEAIINFKWKTFGRKYYLAIWAIYTIFACSFITVVTLSDNISWNYQIFFLSIAVILGLWHLFFEFRQFYFSPIYYFSSTWNYIDLLAIISTILTSIYWLMNGSVSIWAITFSTLFLELKFILFFRFMPFFGSYLAMTMNTIDKVFSFLIIFGLIIFAFAHALYLLLQSTSEISKPSNVSIDEIRKLFLKIQAGNWDKLETPFFPPIILKAIQYDDVSAVISDETDTQIKEIKILITDLMNMLVKKNSGKESEIETEENSDYISEDGCISDF